MREIISPTLSQGTLWLAPLFLFHKFKRMCQRGQQRSVSLSEWNEPFISLPTSSSQLSRSRCCHQSLPLQKEFFLVMYVAWQWQSHSYPNPWVFKQGYQSVCISFYHPMLAFSTTLISSTKSCFPSKRRKEMYVPSQALIFLFLTANGTSSHDTGQKKYSFIELNTWFIFRTEQPVLLPVPSPQKSIQAHMHYFPQVINVKCSSNKC